MFGRSALFKVALLALVAATVPWTAASAQEEAGARDLEPMPFRGEKTGKIGAANQRMRAPDAMAMSSPSVLTTVHVEPGDVERVASIYRTRGLDVVAVGRESIDVRASQQDYSSMAEDRAVRFVSEAIRAEPMVLSEGVAGTRADLLRPLERAGSGAKVAVIDLGFDPAEPEIASRVAGTASFDGLPVNYDLTDHGTACAEIVADMAPDAQLYLLRAQTGTQIENALQWAVDNDMDIVSMSLGYPFGPFDGSSALSQAVTEAVNAGVLVAVSAGNSAGHHWYGTWSDADADGWLNTEGSYETILVSVEAGETVSAYLSWDDWPASDQDYDLALLNGSLSLVAGSVNEQSGSQIPLEFISYTSPVTQQMHFAVQRYSAAGTSTFHLFLGHNGPPIVTPVVASRSIVRPADAVGVFSVGAAGPTGSHAPHSYSSQGPTDDGRIAPFVMSAAGVSTATYGPSGYYGTSAAAPHLAGTLALMRAEDQNLTAAAASTILSLSATDLGSPGYDNATGRGWVDAYSSLFWTDLRPPVVTAVSSLAPRGAGPVHFNVTFSDHLHATHGIVARLNASGLAPVPLNAAATGRNVTLTGTIPAGWGETMATLEIEGARDWAVNRMPEVDRSRSLQVDAVGPLMELVTPAAGSALPPGTMAVRVRAIDGGGLNASSFELSLDSTVLSPVSANATDWVVNVTLSPGAHELAARVSDLVGNRGNATWTLLVNATNEANATTTLTVVMPNATLTPNGTANITIRNASRLASLTLDVDIPPAVVEVANVTLAAQPGGSLTTSYNATSGRLRLLIDTTEPDGWSGNFTLAILGLRGVGSAGTSGNLTGSIVELVNPELATMPGSVVPGRVSIGLRGDANGDGRISGSDALAIRLYVVGRPPPSLQLGLADVTNDGRVSGADALKIAQYVVGRIGSL